MSEYLISLRYAWVKLAEGRVASIDESIISLDAGFTEAEKKVADAAAEALAAL